MCRAKGEGPRCSNGGDIRINRANKYSEKINKKVEAELERNDGKLSKRTEWQQRNAERRMIAAKNVSYATPRGVQRLQDKKDIEEQRISNLPENTPQEKAEKRACGREIKRLDATMERGVANRKMMYHNMRLVGDEKRETREKAMAQGSNTNHQAQKATPEQVDQAMKNNPDHALSLRSWDRDDVKDVAHLWTKERTGWSANENTRPPKGGEGDVVVPSRSNSISMMTADGSYAEARYDIHVRKNKKGKFVVSQRYIGATDWRDGGPMDEPPADTPEQRVGHLLASKKGRINRRDDTSINEFKSQKEATAFATKAQRSISQKASTRLALDSREAFVNRAAKPHGNDKLTKIGRQGGRHLYSESGYESLS